MDSQFNSEPNLPGWFHSLGLHAALSRVAVAPQICSNSEPACTFGRCGRFFAAGLFQNTILRMGLDPSDATVRVFALVLGGEAVNRNLRIEKHPNGVRRAWFLLLLFVLVCATVASTGEHFSSHTTWVLFGIGIWLLVGMAIPIFEARKSKPELESRIFALTSGRR